MIDFNIPKGFIQSVKSSPWHLSFRLRFKGSTKYLMFPRGGKNPVFFISKCEIPQKFRCNNKLREWIKSFCLNYFLSDYNVLKNYVLIEMTKEDNKKYITLYYADNKLYFAGFSLSFSYLLYRKKPNIKYQGVSLREHIESEYDFIKKSTCSESMVSFEEVETYEEKLKFIQLEKKYTKKIERKNEKKIRAIENDLEKLSNSNELKTLLASGQLEVNDDVEIFEYKNIKIKVDKFEGKYSKRDYIFSKCKAYEKAIKIQRDRLQKVMSLKVQPIVKWSDFTLYPAKAVLPEYRKGRMGNIGVTYFGDQGEIFKFGRNIDENVKLRKSWAKKTDYWLHIKDRPSAHCFCRLVNGAISVKQLDYVSKIFCEMEKLKEIKIIYCRVKQLKSLPGEKGKLLANQFNFHSFVSSD